MPSSNRTDSGSGHGPPPRPNWGPAEFAAHLEESFRTFWLIAVGIVKDGSLAEDVVQEAAVVALGKLGDFEPGTNFRAWMGRTIRYVALNFGRKEGRRRTVGLSVSDADDAVVRVSANSELPPLRLTRDGRLPPDQQHFDDRLMAALSEVSETARACLLLRTVDGLEYSEISEILEIPEGTAMSHVHRARQHLRRLLSVHTEFALRAAESKDG